jgi:hypothetical protein
MTRAAKLNGWVVLLTVALSGGVGEAAFITTTPGTSSAQLDYLTAIMSGYVSFTAEITGNDSPSFYQPVAPGIQLWFGWGDPVFGDGSYLPSSDFSVSILPDPGNLSAALTPDTLYTLTLTIPGVSVIGYQYPDAQFEIYSIHWPTSAGQQILNLDVYPPYGTPPLYVPSYVTVPEPASMTLMAVSAIGLLGRRKR